MTGQFGITETLEALDFGLSLVGDVEEFLKDKNPLDFKESIMKFVPAVSGAGQIFPELQDLQSDEVQLIHNKVESYFPNILPAQAQELAKVALDIVTALANAFLVKQKLGLV